MQVLIVYEDLDVNLGEYQCSGATLLLVDCSLELFAGHAASQPGDQVGVGRGFKDVPHFGFRLAAELFGDGGRRMNLKGEAFARVKELHQEWETRGAGAVVAEELDAETLDQLAKGLPGEGAIGDDGLSVVAVADFPTFPDPFAGGDEFAVAGERVSAPDALGEDGMKPVWIEHDCCLAVLLVFDRLHGHKEKLQPIFMGKQTTHSHAREIWAVVLVGVALLLLLSLVSHNPNDLGNTARSVGEPVANFIGPVGAALSFAVFQTFGFGGYALMAVLAGLALLIWWLWYWRVWALCCCWGMRFRGGVKSEPVSF